MNQEVFNLHRRQSKQKCILGYRILNRPMIIVALAYSGNIARTSAHEKVIAGNAKKSKQPLVVNMLYRWPRLVDLSWPYYLLMTTGIGYMTKLSLLEAYSSSFYG